MRQNTQEWLELRKNYIGASDAPVIMGVSPWKTVYQLWQEKLGMQETVEDNHILRNGRQMEGVARKIYQEYTGNLVSPEIVMHPTINYMMASLDGLSIDRDIAVEIKCPGEHDHKIAESGKIPEKYFPQVQHQLACLGINMLHYFSFREGKGVIVEVERDEKYLKSLYEKEKKFWEQVQSFDIPEMTDKDLRLQDEKWTKEADRLYKIGHELVELKKKFEEQKSFLVELSNSLSSIGGDYKFQKQIRRGNINYSKIPELIDIDLEPYRGKMVESWRLTKMR